MAFERTSENYGISRMISHMYQILDTELMNAEPYSIYDTFVHIIVSHLYKFYKQCKKKEKQGTGLSACGFRSFKVHVL